MSRKQRQSSVANVWHVLCANVEKLGQKVKTRLGKMRARDPGIQDGQLSTWQMAAPSAETAHVGVCSPVAPEGDAALRLTGATACELRLIQGHIPRPHVPAPTA